MLKGLSVPDQQTGEGRPGPSWTVGVQTVEIEANLKDCTYRIINAFTVMDVGKAINPELMKESVCGGMSMGISLASRECFAYDKSGLAKVPNLRTYKVLHIGQEPLYHVEFVETPLENSPYGIRNYAEHGIIGISAALGNALSAAFNIELLTLPLTPESIWRRRQDDTL